MYLRFCVQSLGIFCRPGVPDRYTTRNFEHYLTPTHLEAFEYGSKLTSGISWPSVFHRNSVVSILYELRMRVESCCERNAGPRSMRGRWAYFAYFFMYLEWTGSLIKDCVVKCRCYESVNIAVVLHKNVMCVYVIKVAMTVKFISSTTVILVFRWRKPYS